MFIILAAAACYGLILYQPGFNGVVVDGTTGKPLPAASIVCITRIIAYSQILNVGGANPHQDRITFITTDARGRFSVPPYLKIYPGFMHTRTVFLYTSGYDGRRYFQQRYALVKDPMYGMPYASSERKDIPVAGSEPLTFLLSEKSDSPVDTLYLLMDVEHFVFVNREKANDPALRPLILDLYVRFRADAARIRTRLEPNQVQLWDNAMKNLQRELAI